MASTQEYEQAAQGVSASVVEFEGQDKSWIGRIQHALHVTPALVPLIVLIFASGTAGHSPSLKRKHRRYTLL